MIKLVVAEYTQAKVNDMLAKQEEEFNVRIVAINEAHAEEITELNKTHTEEIESINATHAEEVAGLNTTIDGLEAEIDNLEEIIENNPPLPEEAFNITGDCQYRFANGGWDWFIKNYGNRITTEGISDASNMFSQSNVTEIPFVLNVNNAYKLNNLFYSCNSLTENPVVRGNLKFNTSLDMSSIFNDCRNIRNLENAFTPEMLEGTSTIKVTSTYSCPQYNNLFSYCHSLRQVPTWFYKLRISEESTAYPYSSYHFYERAFSECHALDEVINFPVLRCNANLTSNMFSNAFHYCYRLKNFTFETDNGTPYVVKWKSQVIKLDGYVGSYNSSYANKPSEEWSDYQLNYIMNDSKVCKFNSGITADKAIYNAATYAALKDDPDAFCLNDFNNGLASYSRYNHDSAVATINSLPDTSAYLATAGGTNTIKFYGAAGSKTDGGAINTLTAEEIAVAAAKGWTVSLF